MIDPVLFSFKLFTLHIELTWYGLIVMSGVMIGGWLAEREVRRRGENGEALLDAMVWAVVAGILGARLWYVMNAIIGGNRIYLEDPMSIIRPPIAGLHFFGGLLFGAVALIIYLRNNGYDVWLFMDAVAPVALLGQAVGRWGNFINQELYGQPTTLPWGALIPAERRLAQYADMSLFPATTRFHPTYFYEMILNVLAFLFIMWFSRRYEEENKPGTLFSLWLIFAGFIRVFIEFFRPDQPRLGDTFITTSMLVAFLMGVAGVVMYLARYGKIQLAATEDWEEDYWIKKVEKKTTASTRTRKLDAAPEPVLAADEAPAKKAAVKRKAAAKPKATTEKKTATKKASTSSTAKKAPARKKKTES